ncbi:MAG: TetR/AcrR family transcriptional regulator [Sneathiellales bacterium]|nr:TetR/AcrR family transcriptional regulator [Sneathiellales bacterium]
MQETSERRSNRSRTEATRKKLISAARQLFAKKGYAETGTPEIVKAAAVTRGALYHHFEDKSDLFRAVVRQEADAVARHIERETLDPASALDALITGMDAYFDAVNKPGRVRILLLDGPAVLGQKEMNRIDRETGGEELKEGLAYALGKEEDRDYPLDALTLIISAAFDKAALAIAEGDERHQYHKALSAIFSALIEKEGR